MKKIIYSPFVGGIVFAIGLYMLTGVLYRWYQAPIAVAMLLVGGAWLQGLTVRQFVRRIFSGDEEGNRFDTIRHKNGVIEEAS